MSKRKKKKRSLFSWLLNTLLSAVDALCEGISALCVGALKGLGKLLALLARALWRLACLLARAAAFPFACLWRRLTGKNLRAEQCLRLSGEEFEAYFALVMEDNHFRNVEITKGSGDQGVDILCERNGKTYAVQCKNYEGAVGNFAVQEAYAGAQFYGCEVAAVVCPGTFTRGARELAQSTGVELWDGGRLTRMMRRSGRKPRPHRRAIP